jgi:hypothetical protein
MAVSSKASYVYQRYVTDASGLKKTLEKYGVAIIPKVLTTTECDNMYSGMWDALEHLTSGWTVPLNRDDPSTWSSISFLLPLHSMLMQHWGIGHAQYIWDLRQNPKILAIWKTLWNTEDLLVSYDGISCHLPPETTGRGWLLRPGGWLHTDQSYTRNDFECVQSWVTCRDVLTGDATLMVLEGSHKYHGAFALAYPTAVSKDDWYRLDDNQRTFYIDKGCKPVYIKCPKGSMVFWDSRTIHCGQEAMKGRTSTNIRSIVYLCYTSRTLATKADLKKKQKYLNERRMTTHWPHKVKVFPKLPRLYPGQVVPTLNELPEPILNSTGMALAGF